MTKEPFNTPTISERLDALERENEAGKGGVWPVALVAIAFLIALWKIAIYLFSLI